jgi:methionine-rich copper-binding protein CopC
MNWTKSLPAALLVSAVLALTTGAAWAHAELVQSDPAPNTTVSAPKSIKLTFSEKLAPKFSGFDLSMGDGMDMSVTTTVSDDGKSLIGTPKGNFMAGAYKLSWHAVTVDDGHRTEGSLTFKVK